VTRQQRLVFGEVAELYDRVRPSYPSALVDAVIDFTGVPTPSTIEVGGGTGKATVLFAQRGVKVHVVEPSAEMLAVAGQRLAAFPQVTFDQASFEEWNPRGRTFDLLIAAQAWHWVPPRVRFQRAREVLPAGGTIAIFGNRPLAIPEPMRSALEACYVEHAPELADRRPGALSGTIPADDDADRELAEEMAGLFGPFETRVIGWSAQHRAAEYAELISTFSHHRMLPPQRLGRLLDAVQTTIDANGGVLEHPYAVEAILARRAP
jgi:SAM-dependent methyltransferase